MKDNFAFIDAQNLFRGVVNAGIYLDYAKFRVYLADRYQVGVAYLCIGYVARYGALYADLERAGFILSFKPVLLGSDRRILKGDVDAHLAYLVMRYRSRYRESVLVTSDGDFDSLVGYLRLVGQLAAVLGTTRRESSVLLKRAAGPHMHYLEDVGSKILQDKK